MSVGSRIVAFDTAFNREALGNAALTFTFDNHGLCTTIRAVLDAPPADNDAARADAAARVAEEFEADAVVGAYEDLLIEAARYGRRTGLVVPRAESTP